MRKNARNLLQRQRPSRRYESREVNKIRLVGFLISTMICTSAAYASEDDGIRLIKSAVCDPPIVHSDDPLGIRVGHNGKDYSKVPGAFVISLGFELKTAKLLDAQIKGSLEEEFQIVSASKNEIALSAPKPSAIHAVRLLKEADGFWVLLHLVDEMVLRTKCYKTGSELF